MAYRDWQGARADRLQQLFDAHQAVGGSGAGRRWRTEQINWSLVLLLAAEFQGYSRDLHNEAGEVFAKLIANGNPKLEQNQRIRLTQGRQLDKGNANPGNLGNDFRFFSLDLWADLKARWPARTAKWNSNLLDLNHARNALAHSESGKIQSLTLTLDTVTKWRSSLDGLTEKMDHVVGEHLCDLFTITDPWQQIGGTP